MSLINIDKELKKILKNKKCKINSDFKYNYIYIENNTSYLYELDDEQVFKNKIINNNLNNIYVDFYCYNINYCKIENLHPKILKSLNLDKEYKIINYINKNLLLEQLLVDMYKLDYNHFIKKLNSNNFGKKNIKNFLLQMPHILPLNENYLKLIVNNIDSNDLEKFIYVNENMYKETEVEYDSLRFNVKELDLLLSHYKEFDYNVISNIIYNLCDDQELLLDYLEVIIKNIHIINDEKIKIIKKNMCDLGITLLNLNIENNKYIKIINDYINKGGCTEFKSSISELDTLVENFNTKIYLYQN